MERPASKGQLEMIRGSIRRLAVRLRQSELAVETYVKRELDIDSLYKLSMADASIIIDHIKWMDTQIVVEKQKADDKC